MTLPIVIVFLAMISLSAIIGLISVVRNTQRFDKSDLTNPDAADRWHPRR